MSDIDVIRAIQAGDRVMVATLYERYLPAIWRYAHAQLRRDRHAAEDLVSDTFLNAISTIHKFDPERGTVYAWLLGIARNRLRQQFRQSTRHHHDAESIANAPAECVPPDQGLVTAETKDVVVSALNSLADDERLVLEWKYVEHLSVRQIAERTGRTEKAVEAVLYRARQSFRHSYVRQQAPGTKAER